MIATLLLVSVLAAPAAAPPRGDAAAAEQQYRVARRLAAEGSPEALAAFRKVVELDPSGPLAPEALVEQAVLQGAPGWPEGAAAVGAASARAAAELLGGVAGRFPSAPRATEARYRGALLRLAPLAGRDPAKARVELLSVATAPGDPAFIARARYALGWIDEAAGEDDLARAAYQRLVLTRAHDEVAIRARVGLGRVALRKGEFGTAAAWLQEAVDASAPAELHAEDLRELAVRGVLRESGGSGWGAKPEPAPAGPLKSVTALAALPGGAFVAADRRGGSVARWGGGLSGVWVLDGPEALSVDDAGRPFAGAGGRVLRLDDAGPATVAQLDRFGTPSAIAADAEGNVFVADRRGAKIGRIDPQTGALTVLRESKDTVAALLWDGRRILGLEDGGGRVFELGRDGSTRTVAQPQLRGASGFAADAAGQIAILDTKAAEVVLLTPRGDLLERVPLRDRGVAKPAAVALASDGALVLADAATGGLMVFP